MNAFTIRIHGIFLPVWSFVVNLMFWSIRFWKIPQYRRILEALTIESVNDIRTNMKTFQWREDRFGEWRPWILTFIASGYHDDCDGAATWARYLFKLYGHDAKIYNLWNRTSMIGHAVCYCDVLGVLVSNNDVVEFKNNKWQLNILEAFGNEYTMISHKGKIIYSV